MPSQSDLDQGGTQREWVRTYLGPSVGWIRTPAQNRLQITSPGSYTLNLSTSLVEVNVAGSVTITLPSAISSPAGAQAQPETFAQVPVTILDVGGHATLHPITVQAQVGQTVMGSASVTIASNYGGYVFQPSSDISGWNSITPQGVSTAPPPSLVTPEQFGAVGDGSTDDTAAIQAAINYALSLSPDGRKIVYFPQTYYTATGFTVSFGSGTAYLSLVGAGKQRKTFITDQNVPILTFDATHDLYYMSVENVAFAGNSSFGLTNQVGILVKNNDPGFFNYYNFSNIFVAGMYAGIYFSQTVGGHCDWGMINNINFNGVVYGIRSVCGGTGCIYWGGNIVLAGAGGGATISIGVGSSGSTQIGDITIGGFQTGGTGAGVVLFDPGTYGANISVSNMQFDAGINPAFNITNIHDIFATGINYGGGSGPNIVTTSTGVSLNEDRIGVSSIGTSTQNDWALLPIGHGVQEFVVTGGGDLTITGIAGGYDGRPIELYNTGTSNNVILRNENAGSSASNRFHINADATVAPGQSILLRYVGNNGTTVTNRWVRRGGA